MLNISLLNGVKKCAGKITSQCPVCAQGGRDLKGRNHLFVFDTGEFGCIEKCDTKLIFSLVGSKDKSHSTQGSRTRLLSKETTRSGWPKFDETLNPSDIAQLSRLRNLNPESLEEAHRRGLLRFCDYEGHRCWIVTDSRRVNAQARRLDGQPLKTALGKTLKAKSLLGSEASEPLGIDRIQDSDLVALTEGGPDFLSVLHHAWPYGQEGRVAPVAMLGSGHRIPDESLDKFRGKRVRIFPHSDEAGRKAGREWARQLLNVGCKVDRFEFTGFIKMDGSPVKDLNDMAKLDVDCWEANFNKVEGLMMEVSHV